jgi:hypothetical protein
LGERSEPHTPCYLMLPDSSVWRLEHY